MPLPSRRDGRTKPEVGALRRPPDPRTPAMHPAGMPETGHVNRSGAPTCSWGRYFTCPFIDLPGGFRLVSACHLHPAGMPETGHVNRSGGPTCSLGRYFTCPFIDLPGGFRLVSARHLHPAGMAEQSRRSKPRADLRIRERQPCILQGCQRRGLSAGPAHRHAPGGAILPVPLSIRVDMPPPSRRDGRTKPEVGASRRPPDPRKPAMHPAGMPETECTEGQALCCCSDPVFFCLPPRSSA